MGSRAHTGPLQTWRAPPGYLCQPSWSQALRQLHERHSKGWGWVPGGPRARPQVRVLGPRARSDTEGHEGTRAELAPDEREMRRKQTLRPRLATQGKSTDSITLTHPRPQAFQSTEATPTCCLCPGHPQPPTASVPHPLLCQPLATSSPRDSAQKHKRLSLQTHRPDSVHLSVSIQPASPGQCRLLSKY